MLRLPKKFNGPTRKKVITLWKDQQQIRNSSQGTSKHGLHAVVIGGVGFTTLIGGVIGYSAWSVENRKAVEKNIPLLSYLLHPILGPLPIESTQKKAETSKSEPSLLKKKINREKEKENVGAKKSSPQLPSEEKLQSPPVVPPPLPVPPVDQPAKPSNVSMKDLDRRLAQGEAAASAEKAALERRLAELTTEARRQMTSALGAAEQAAVAIRRHAEKAYAAIDSGLGDVALFAAAADVAKAKDELVRAAEQQLEDAKRKVEVLQEEVSRGRGATATRDSAALTEAEEALSELSCAVASVDSTVAEALRDTSAVSEFRDLVEASRSQFEAEVRSLLPDVKLGETSDKLTPEELNLLLAHAHRKVLALQKALAKQQTVDKERFKDSVLRQREMESKLVDRRLEAELERQRRDLALDHRVRLQQLREDLEAEMRTQLKRQAAAHSDHLADVISVHERQLGLKWESRLQDELQAASDDYNRHLSGIQGDLNGLKSALKTRAEADRAAHAAHELWFACESLLLALRLGKSDSPSWEDQLLPLQDKVKAITDTAGDDRFVRVVVGSLPQEALSRGVYTEDALRQRFLKVDRVCRRVALVGDGGAALPKYWLSYIQSFFLVGAHDRIPTEETRDDQIDPDAFNTHDILARTRYCLAKGDLARAVRYLNLLRGEPRLVASDWLKEARLALEARQAAQVLLAHAAATGARAL